MWAEYIGETSRSVRDRFTEHFRQARRKMSGTPWGTHYEAHHDASMPSSPFTKTCILASENSHVNPRMLEAVFIRERKPAVNNDCGWTLLD